MISYPLIAKINPEIGMSILAGLLAAAASYYLNGKALALMGKAAISYGAPVIEELTKTGLAVLLSGDIFLSHIIFGAAEASCDIIKNRGRLSYAAGAAGLISHTAFGAITVCSGRFLKSLLPGIAAAVIIHMCWNYAVTRINIKAKK